MASSSSSSPEAAPPRRVEYVGFWKRVVASLIDTLILLIVIVPLLLAVYGRNYFERAQASGFAGGWDFVIQAIMPAVAVILFWKFRGATPGKMAISARIVSASTGAAPGTGQLVGRYFAYLVSALPFGLGFIWIAIDRRKQGFHDKLAGTVVVYDDD